VPYGCSVWPAIWTLGQSRTDEDGEIDIFESVNARTQNQFTLHTNPGCTQSNSTAYPYANSTVVSTDCDHTINQNQGCGFQDIRDTSAGQGFSQGGGGVFAMLWDGSGIRTWFFPRNAIPTDIVNGAPSPASWPEPQASWPAATCNPSTFFTDQNLIININICGSFAGNAAVFSQTCSGVCTDLVADPANYECADLLL
jgi:hypothetical protein